MVSETWKEVEIPAINGSGSVVLEEDLSVFTPYYRLVKRRKEDLLHREIKAFSARAVSVANKQGSCINADSCVETRGGKNFH